MSQTLYRKYRSQRFAEIIGQGSVVRILRNSISRGRLNHAYLFSGPRGTGKTSIARIFAKALNCINPQDGDACGVCNVCVSIAAGSAVDVIEIDAASNRGIDDIRDLRERVNYAPLELQRKVYIIDEVHMITGPAWNALLKTLEEPPSHVIFCLCTTEANKVPITILSRCIRFDFQRLPLAELATHLEFIARTEGFTLGQGCGMKLAQLAEGSARDAISLLDQLTVYCEAAINPQDIDELFQLGDPSLVRGVADSVLSGDSSGALETWNTLMTRGVDAGSFLLQLAENIKHRFLIEGLAHQSSALQAVWQGLNLLKFDSFPALLVELTLIQAAGEEQQSERPRTVVPEATDARPIQTRERVQENRRDPPLLGSEAPDIGAPDAAHVRTESNSQLETPAIAERPLAHSNLIEPFRAKVQQMRMTTFALLLKAVSAVLEGNRFIVTFGANERQALSFAGQEDTLRVLREAARQLHGQHTVIELRREGDAATHTSSTLLAEEAAESPSSNEAAAALESSEPSSDRPANYDDAVRLFPSPQE